MLTSGAHSSVPPFHPRIRLLCFLQKPQDAYKSQQKLTRLLSLSRREIKLAFHSEKKFENAEPNTLTVLSRLNFRRPNRVSQSCGQGVCCHLHGPLYRASLASLFFFSDESLLAIYFHPGWLFGAVNGLHSRPTQRSLCATAAPYSSCNAC